MRNISNQYNYNEVIDNIIIPTNIESEWEGLNEIVGNKNKFNVFVSTVDLQDEFTNSGMKKFYWTGSENKELYNDGDISSLLLSTNEVQITDVNIEIIKEIHSNKTNYIKKAKEVYKIVKDFLFSQLISETEFIESLPELCSDGQDTWLHKKMTVFISLESSKNIFLFNLRNLISEKLSGSDVRIDSKKEEGIVNYQVYIEGKNILSINMQKSPYKIQNLTVPIISPSLKIQYPVDKYVKDYFEPITVFAANHNNYEDEQDLSKSIITDSISDTGQDNLEFVKTNENSEQKQIPQIAIILDDGGYRNPKDDPVLELASQITLSILPDTKYCKELAEMADEKGFEIMLHMPMQTRPGVKKGSFPCELLTQMSENQIKEKTNNALEQILEAKGVNNHTGGVFTLKEEPLKYFMKVLKEKKIFFVDSVVVG
ncbi:MAG TPA: divergent polysaccharide deacetylase family protein, partial [Candidatus Hydrogenedens sp.]|nr:divergent polysaccharide deacetylase family protein [Candidatus Hydrogenedens sp.]